MGEPAGAARLDRSRSRAGRRATRLAVRHRVVRWIGILLALGGPALVLPFGTGAGGSGATATGFHCRIVFGSTPAALLIPNGAPSAPLAAGSTLGFQYEARALNYSTAVQGRILRFPEALVNFPLSGGGTISVYSAKVALPILGPNWTNANLSSGARSVPTATAFAPGAGTNLSTMKLAVMANDSYGSIQLAVRWRWTAAGPAGPVSYGPWSVPNATAFHPSVLYPAPYVQLLARSSTNATLGSPIVATLGGAIGSEAFFLELEHPSGLVVSSRGETAPPGNRTPFNATMPLESADTDLAPGPMLLHLHNHCGSMLYSLPVTGAFPPNASVGLATSAAACGTLDVNGHPVRAGGNVTLRPNGTAVPIDAPSCIGHRFSQWTSTGGLDLTTATSARTSVLVSYQGTLTADYR